MEEREENRHERLKQQFRELEEEWTAMKTGKSSSAVSRITMEEALVFVENSPRNLMLSLQDDPEAEMIQNITPLRRKLFHDSGDESDDDAVETKKTTLFSHSSCWSSNVMRTSDSNTKKKKRGIIVCVTMVLLWLWGLILLMSEFYHLSMDTQINTLVPT